MATINERQMLYDSLTTSTWFDVRAGIIDQVFQITPMYDKLVESGRIRSRVPDGTHFEISIRYDRQDQNTQWFGRGAKFGRAEKESLTRLFYQTKNLGTSIVRFWDDDRKNRGDAQIINYVEEIVENTRISLQDSLATDLWVEDSDPLSITALPTLISTTPTTGSVGGQTRSSNPYLVNQTTDMTSDSVAALLLDRMRTMYNDCSLMKFGGRRTPNLIITTQTIYETLEGLAEDLRVFDTNKTQRYSFGMGDLMYKGAEIFWDPECPAGNMYFLNTDTLELAYDPSAWFWMNKWKEDADGLDRTTQVVAVCQLLCTNFLKNGVIFNIGDTA